MNNISTRSLPRARVLEFIEGLNDSTEYKWSSLYITPGSSSTEVKKVVKSLDVDSGRNEEIIGIFDRSKTGMVIFRYDEHLCIILPPLPVRANIISPSLNAGPLLTILQTDYHIAIVLVRLGSYGIGVCQGEKLITSKVGTGLIHGRHKKGGSSAHRFERHRDKQIEYFLNRVCQRTREQLEPHLKSLDYLLFGGSRTAVQLLQKQCPFIGKLETETLPPLFDIPEPCQTVLEKAVSHLWSSMVIEWTED